MSKEERQTRKELNQLVYPNHLKFLKKLKADLKKDKGTKMYSKRKSRKNITMNVIQITFNIILDHHTLMSG